MPASEPPGPRGGLRVLLVEDENLVALLLEDMLADLGHSVVGPVARLKKALEIAQREAIDLAVLDVNINGEESYPIADVLAARGIPFVFSTGYGKLPPQYRDRPTLHKPFQQHDLQRLFAEVLR
jgi:CheY-like chemotaxis protein